MWLMLLLGLSPAIVFGKQHPTLGPQHPTLGPDGVLHAHYSNSLYAVNSDGSTKWIFDAGARLGSHAEGLNGTVYAAAQGAFQVEASALFALDSLDGSIKWKHQVDKNRYTSTIDDPLVVATDGTIYLTSRILDRGAGGTTIDAIDTNGALKWTFSNAGGSGSLSAVGADGTLFMRNSNSFDALHPDTGIVKWSVVLHECFQSLLQVALAEDGNVFLMQSEPNCSHGMQSEQNYLALSRLSNADGSILWKVPLSAWHDQWRICSNSPMTLGSNREVYVNFLTENGTCILRVFDFDGNSLRNLPCLRGIDGNSLRNLPCLAGSTHYRDEDNVFVTVTPGNVWAHTGTDGGLLWNVSVPDYLGEGARFGQEGTVLVWSYGDRPNAHAHAIRNGEVAWSVQTGGASQQLMLEDGTTYVQGYLCQKGHPGCVYGLEIVTVGADGVEKWRYTPTEAAAELV